MPRRGLSPLAWCTVTPKELYDRASKAWFDISRAENRSIRLPSYAHSVINMETGTIMLMNTKQTLLAMFHYNSDTDRLQYIRSTAEADR